MHKADWFRLGMKQEHVKVSEKDNSACDKNTTIVFKKGMKKISLRLQEKEQMF